MKINKPLRLALELGGVVTVYVAVAMAIELMYGRAGPRVLGRWTYASLALGAAFGILAFVIVGRIQDTLRWFMHATTTRIGLLEQQLEGAASNQVQSEQPSWPWGSHHTELLGHLEAAAKQFWVLYDPSDPTTAPTNEVVSNWLRFERNVSREKAQAIASILRADGLRTGPR